MNNQIELNDKIVADYLTNWFNTPLTQSEPEHFWKRNQIGQVIKDNLIKSSHWKNKPRGKKQKELKDLVKANAVRLSAKPPEPIKTETKPVKITLGNDW
jgi:hypothetical protein